MTTTWTIGKKFFTALMGLIVVLLVGSAGIGWLAFQLHAEARSPEVMTLVYVVLSVLALQMVAASGVTYLTRGINGAILGLTSTLSAGTEQVVATAAQVAALAQSLSHGAAEQAASLEETSTSMEEMASMTRCNADNATQAMRLVTDVATIVTESNAALAEMVTSMAAIKESSNKVAKIIKTIDEIAFQTNILALNAAVEAARAGAAGMGFAVVADEVRNLAQRSAQAARDTAALIEESIARSHEGAGKVELVASAVDAITKSVVQVKGMVEEVREASLQQTQGIDQVSQAIAQMEKVTQTTAATAAEGAAASEELNAQAASSIETLHQLQLLADTESARRPDASMKALARTAGHSRRSHAFAQAS